MSEKTLCELIMCSMQVAEAKGPSEALFRLCPPPLLRKQGCHRRIGVRCLGVERKRALAGLLALDSQFLRIVHASLCQSDATLSDAGIYARVLRGLGYQVFKLPQSGGD